MSLVGFTAPEWMGHASVSLGTNSDVLVWEREREREAGCIVTGMLEGVLCWCGLSLLGSLQINAKFFSLITFILLFWWEWSLPRWVGLFTSIPWGQTDHQIVWCNTSCAVAFPVTRSSEVTNILWKNGVHSSCTGPETCRVYVDVCWSYSVLWRKRSNQHNSIPVKILILIPGENQRFLFCFLWTNEAQ